MANGKYVTYLRVSTERQGVSGLGLDAQRATVEAHLNGGKWKIVAECIEVESGGRNDRPELAKALRLCRLHGARLLVAKLDRLSRSVAFLANLMEAKVPFTAADMPEADETHLNLMAVFAQHERRCISNRTKAALQASKAKGTVLGGRRVSAERFREIAAEGRQASIAVRCRVSAERSQLVKEVIEDIRKERATRQNKPVTLREVAADLNERGIPTPRGGVWSAAQVQRIERISRGSEKYS